MASIIKHGFLFVLAGLSFTLIASASASAQRASVDKSLAQGRQSATSPRSGATTSPRNGESGHLPAAPRAERVARAARRGGHLPRSVTAIEATWRIADHAFGVVNLFVMYLAWLQNDGRAKPPAEPSLSYGCCIISVSPGRLSAGRLALPIQCKIVSITQSSGRAEKAEET